MNSNYKSASVLKPVLFLILGLAMIGAAWWLTKMNAEKQKKTRELLEIAEKQKIKRQRQELFAVTGSPLLDQEEQRNLEAMQRARLKLRSCFSLYSNGVPVFIKDLTSWGTRYNIAKSALSDWWSKSNETRKIATDKFSKMVVSDQKLQADITATMEQFSSDLKANRNKMLSQLQEKITTAAVPCASTDQGSDNLIGAFMVEVQPLIQKRAVESPIIGFVGTGGGFIAGDAATSIVTKLLTSMAARVATGAAARGSAVASGAIAGGGSGTVMTPGVGTAIGIIGGIVVGGAVDLWMESRFKEKVTSECNQLLNDMEESLWNDPKEGFSSSFNKMVGITRGCHEKALRKIIIGDE